MSEPRKLQWYEIAIAMLPIIGLMGGIVGGALGGAGVGLNVKIMKSDMSFAKRALLCVAVMFGVLALYVLVAIAVRLGYSGGAVEA